MERLINILKEKTHSYTDELSVLRRHFHLFPELSYKEYNTSEFICEYLSKHNIDYVSGLAGTGIIAILKGNKGDGPCIGLRAELDALPVTEKTGLSFSSQNQGVMHACGHDAHLAMLLISILTINQIKDEFRGTIIFIFQPGEELAPGGASLIMKEKIFREMNPDLIIAQHVLPEMETAHFGFRKGKYMASSDEIYITIKGKGGHAALEGQNTDQILIASNLVADLKKSIKQIKTENPVILGIGRLIADGATNVIPDTVLIEGTLRTFNEDIRKNAQHIITEACISCEKDNNVKLDLEIRKGYPVLENHKEYSEKAKELAICFNGIDNITDLDLRMSSEDFAFYSEKYPVVFYRIGTHSKNTKQKSLHSPDFNIDETAMLYGVRTMSFLAIEFANNI